MREPLTTAIRIANDAHEGQVDKAGAPYILHPIRVMLRLSNETERIVAVLHDTIEDTDVTIEMLRSLGFSEEILEAVLALTHQERESYEDFVLRVKENPLAAAVKRADIADNMDLTRLHSVTERDKARQEKYARALLVLN